MTHKPQQFVVIDPREFDGTPFEVAERAFAQANALARLTAHAIEGANQMALNAHMSREYAKDGNPQARAWEDSALGRKCHSAHHDAKQLERLLDILRTATSYDPKNPPKA